MSLFGNGRGPIGLDVDGRFIKAVQLRGPSKRQTLAAAMKLPKSDPSVAVGRADVDQLRDALVRQGFEGQRIALAVPEDKIVTGMLELPLRSSGAPLDDIARTELATMHGYDPQVAEAATWDLPPSIRVKDATQAMAVALRHTDAESLLAIFDEAGLEIVSLESRMDAIVQACRSVLVEGGVKAILELEWNAAILNLWHQGAVIYRWTIPTAGLKQLTDSLAASIQLDQDQVDCLLSDVGLAPSADNRTAGYEAAATTIRRHFDAAVAAMESPRSYMAQLYPEAPIDGVVLTGPGAAIPGIDDYFKSRLAAATRCVMPADIVNCPNSMGGREKDPSLTVAIGMARETE
jgi:type IV pilus assembly protein PilM